MKSMFFTAAILLLSACTNPRAKIRLISTGNMIIIEDRKLTVLSVGDTILVERRLNDGILLSEWIVSKEPELRDKSILFRNILSDTFPIEYRVGTVVVLQK